MYKQEARYTVFPEAKERIAPVALYETIYPKIPRPRNEVYFSSPITSGGAKRLYDGQAVADNMPTIIRLNSAFAETVAQESEATLAAERFTLPHRIGSQEGWKEVDFLKFWMSYLSGIKPTHARQFDAAAGADLGINLSVFNNYALPRERRIQEYERLVDGFADFISSADVPTNPVAGIVCLPDHKLSVGCSAETRLARALNIPTQEISFDKNNPRYPNLLKFAPWLENEGHTPKENSSSASVLIFQAL